MWLLLVSPPLSKVHPPPLVPTALFLELFASKCTYGKGGIWVYVCALIFCLHAIVLLLCVAVQEMCGHTVCQSLNVMRRCIASAFGSSRLESCYEIRASAHYIRCGYNFVVFLIFVFCFAAMHSVAFSRNKKKDKDENKRFLS